MAEQQRIDTDEQPDGNADGNVGVTAPRPLFPKEWFFNREVHEYATHHGWRPFHTNGLRVVRGRGFPDLAMFRKDIETGAFEMLVAELKLDADSEFGEGQEEWLEAFRQMGITTKVWRADNQEHLAELYRLIEEGTSGEDSITELPRGTFSPIPRNFSVVIANTIDSIQGEEMTTGEKASLRRMDSDNPDSAVFWRLMSQRGMEGVDIRKWGLITHGISLMAHGAGLAHTSRISVGMALYQGGGNRAPLYSEDRLATLLSSRGPTLHRLLARLFRMLANEGCAFNWREMAWFILNEEYREEEADKSRIEIASAYYRAMQRGTQQSNTQGDSQ